MADISVDELADLKSKARAFDEMKSQKTEVNSKNQKLREQVDSLQKTNEDMQSQIAKFKEAGLDPKEFKALKTRHDELVEAVEVANKKAGAAETQLLGMKYGVRADEDALTIFASKLNAARSEANGDFDEAAFAKQLQEEKSFLFGEAADTGTPKAPPRVTPGGKGSAGSSGGDDLQGHLRQIDNAIAELQKQPWASKAALDELRFEKQAVMSRMQGGSKGS